MLVVKSDGSWRFCVDYRELNSITVKDSYPLPQIVDTIDSLGGSQVFSTLDLMAGYWQVRLTEDAKKKTTFVTHLGAYCFNVMPFGLTNAPAAFQRCMDTILGSLKNICCLVYLDDIIIYSKDNETHLQDVEKVLGLLMKAGAKLKVSKCNFFAPNIKYLGHIISKDGVRVDNNKYKAIQNWPAPKSKKDAQSFIGFVNFYRRFIFRISEKVEPINKLAYSKRPFMWTNEANIAFENLKLELTSDAILRFPKFDKPFFIDSDFSSIAIGAILYQEHGVIGYYSKKLKPYQSRYQATEGELLAIVSAVKHFRPYLYGQNDTIIYTDHDALKYLNNNKHHTNQRLLRWATELSPYNLKY